jgi:hypothetical protein
MEVAFWEAAPYIPGLPIGPYVCVCVCFIYRERGRCKYVRMHDRYIVCIYMYIHVCVCCVCVQRGWISVGGWVGGWVCISRLRTMACMGNGKEWETHVGLLGLLS